MRQGRVLRLLLLAALSLSLLLALSWFPILLRSPEALAQSFVIGSDPVDGSTINTLPTQVRIFFNTPISSASFANVYFGVNYQVMNADQSHVVGNNLRELDTPLIAQVPQGSYIVRWTALSTTDGRTTHGVIGFNIGHSTTGFPGQVILGPSTSNILPQLSLQGLLAIAWDWLVIAALALWIGILVMEGVVLVGIKSESGRNESEVLRERGRRSTRDLSDEGERSSVDRASRGRIEVNPIPFANTFMAQVRKRTIPLQWLCLAALLAGEIINLILRATLLTQFSNNNGIDPAAIRDLIVNTTYGHLWLVRFALIGAALIFLWWTTRSIKGQSIGNRTAVRAKAGGQTRHTIAWLTLAGLILLTLALSEDVTQLAQAHGSAVVLYWLFLAAQGTWIGGTAYLGFALLPLLSTIEPELHSRYLVALLQRCTFLIPGSIAILLVSGLFLVETSLSSMQQLMNDPFGRALLVRIALIILMLLLSSYALFSLGPRISRQVRLLPVVNAEMPARRARQTALERNERRLIITMKSLTYLGAGTLLCAALMSFFAPPIDFPAIAYTSNTSGSSTSTTPSTTNKQIIQTKQIGDLTINLQITPARVSYANTVIVTMNDSNGDPITGAQVQISINMEAMDMGIAESTIKGGNPTYITTFSKNTTFSMPGTWIVALKIQRPNQLPVQVVFQVTVTG